AVSITRSLGGAWQLSSKKAKHYEAPCASYWAGVAVWRLDNALQASPRDDDDRRDHVLVQPRPGDIIGRIAIPRIHVSVMVLEGSDSHILRVADGHVPGTALPGTIRKRRDRGPPRHLLSAAARDSFNDVITPTSLHGTFKYCVDGTEIVDAR
ncbi:MAG: hypothetical protein DME64_17130, partial [Verrucomicrobia bacterium]